LEKFEMINWENVFKNSDTFKNNKPFPFGFVEEVLPRDFYEKLCESFPKEDEKWHAVQDYSRSAKKRYFGLDKKNSLAIDDRDPSLSEEWNIFHHYLTTKEFADNISKYTGIKLTGLRQFSFINNHKGDFNMPHTHWDDSQEGPQSYKITFLMFFAKKWPKGEPGGTYVCASEDESSIVFEPPNLDNTMIGFKETRRSWHGSRYITKDLIRHSIQFTLY
jgi:hypothetical protein